MPPGDARPAWKIMRVSGGCARAWQAFDYESPETLTREAQQQCASVELNNHH